MSSIAPRAACPHCGLPADASAEEWGKANGIDVSAFLARLRESAPEISRRQAEAAKQGCRGCNAASLGLKPELHTCVSQEVPRGS
jgi:hypothetical protein